MNIKLIDDNESNSIVLVWPDMDNMLIYGEIIKNFYLEFIKKLLNSKIFIILLIDNINDIRKINTLFNTGIKERVKIVKFKCNDIWIRDYGGIMATSINPNNSCILKYNINGYGHREEFKENQEFNDNFEEIIFNNPKKYINVRIEDIIMEGGNFVYNDKIILFNENVLRMHNKTRKVNEIINSLKHFFSKLGYKICSININNISGDDTNGHIDNLIRIHDNKILYMATSDKNHPDFKVLQTLEIQIKGLLKMLPEMESLPIEHTCEDIIIKNNKVLPFSYLNYLKCKDYVFFPKSKKLNDKTEFKLKSIFNNYKIEFIDIDPILVENGGLHCCTLNIIYE